MSKNDNFEQRKRICDEFQKEMKRRGLTYEKLAKKTGVPKSTIHNWFGCGVLPRRQYQFLWVIEEVNVGRKEGI